MTGPDPPEFPPEEEGGARVIPPSRVGLIIRRLDGELDTSLVRPYQDLFAVIDEDELQRAADRAAPLLTMEVRAPPRVFDPLGGVRRRAMENDPIGPQPDIETGEPCGPCAAEDCDRCSGVGCLCLEVGHPPREKKNEGWDGENVS